MIIIFIGLSDFYGGSSLHTLPDLPSVTFTKDNTLNDTTYVYGLGTRFYLTGTLATYSIAEGKYTGDVKYVTERNSQNFIHLMNSLKFHYKDNRFFL